ncbi:MAG: AAA-like domain-containing protein [Chitinispirillia bacterium]|nr:AAA-like domain-containing protein [Chitinispirillia bacterium]MCL2269556.1 AAA-like domain-containing protein [Chitinispirillia bacterium]
MRDFNVTGLCVPNLHYMADTGEKVSRIVQFVEKRCYFSINRGRQYGKTTTFSLLEKSIRDKYSVIRISFEAVSDSMFETENNFCQGFLSTCSTSISERNLPGAGDWIDSSVTTFDALGNFINKICSDKKIVLMIDEVDKASNNVIFLKFLGLLRDKYLKRNDGIGATFQSVILAGVYDIKNLKHKMILAGTHQLQDGEKRLNSPWNIAINFNVDMSLNEKEIASMLTEYEKDHHTGMNIEAIAAEIRTYTNGYPYLVSGICRYIEEELNKDWTMQGIQNAIKKMLIEQSTLFDDIFKNMNSYPDLKELLRELTVGNRVCKYNADNETMQFATMFGIIEERDGQAAIHNRIFEIRIANYFASKKETTDKWCIPGTSIRAVAGKENFDMPMFLEKFANHYYEIYREKDINFLERECRLLFITYLQPYINGTGFYHLESEIRDDERTDIIIDYLTEQFIVELKLWHGKTAHERAYEQLFGYLNSKNKDTGYLLTFDFRKTKNTGKPKLRWVNYQGKKIFDVMVGFDCRAAQSGRK